MTTPPLPVTTTTELFQAEESITYCYCIPKSWFGRKTKHKKHLTRYENDINKASRSIIHIEQKTERN